MLKITLALLLALNALVLSLLVAGIVARLASPAGGINILLPGLGLITSLDFILLVLCVVELALAAVTLAVYRRYKNGAGSSSSSSNGLA